MILVPVWLCWVYIIATLVSGVYLLWLDIKVIPEKNREQNRLYILIEDLKNPPPVAYNEYDPGDGKPIQKVPLGQMGSRWAQSLKAKSIAGRIEAANDILHDEDNKHKFQVVLITDKGIFIRLIEEEASNILTVDDEGFQLKMQWAPIHFSQDTLVYEGFIIYRDRIMNYIRSRDEMICAGDILNVFYTFSN